MSLPGSGCCCGVIVGLVLAVVLAAVGTLAFYYWKNPEACKESVASVEKAWKNIKAAGDSVIEWAKETDVPEVSVPKVSVPKAD